LTGVSFELSGSANAVLSFISNAPSNTPFTNGSVSTTFGFISGTGLTSFFTAPVSTTVASGTITGSSTASFVTTNLPGAPASIDLLDSANGAALSSFEGGGSTAVTVGFGDFTSSASFSTPQPYFTGVGGNGQATGDLTVTYTYTPSPVPLPSSLPLLMAGGALFFLFRRRQDAASL
jgi:hypothetical protein